jgi:hypothetical protein
MFAKHGNEKSTANKQMIDLVCYCFAYSREDIEQDVLKNGRSLIMEKIMAAKRFDGCQCSTKNPRGR